MPDEMMIRTSERMSFKKCRQQWYWGYVNKLQSTTPNRHLRFGTGVHYALEKRYKPGIKRGPHPAKTFVKWLDMDESENGPLMMKDWEAETSLSARDLGVAMLEGFVDEYGTDDRYRIISPEMPFQIDIHSRGGVYICTYVGTIDAVAEDLHTGEIILLEWKTGIRLEVTGGAPLSMDEQGGSYWAYAPDWLESRGILKAGASLDGIMYTFMRKAMPDSRPTNEKGLCLNKNGSISKVQPAPRFRREMVYRSEKDRANLMRRVEQEAREIRKARSGKLAIYKNPGDHCKWCQYRDMCEVHESGSDWRALKSAMFTTWRPYEVHDTEVAV
jgi:hypothetical protein